MYVSVQTHWAEAIFKVKMLQNLVTRQQSKVLCALMCSLKKKCFKAAKDYGTVIPLVTDFLEGVERELL